MINQINKVEMVKIERTKINFRKEKNMKKIKKIIMMEKKEL
jgi:hypothetical protein